MRYIGIITYGCIIIMLFTLFQGISFSTPPSTRAGNWDPNSPAKTFEDLFLPHWFENGTYTFDVPEYMHHFKLAESFEWAQEYQYGDENGKLGICNITDNLGNSYGGINNTSEGVPVGGPGQCDHPIYGSQLIIKVHGKIMIQFGVWGEWFENIIEGGKYNITFSGKRISLYMDYYNPTDKHTFYFKASKPVYAYLFDSGGRLIGSTDKEVIKGSLTEPYDASPFLVFERPDGVEGNITVQFWMGYEPAKPVDYTGVGIMAGIFILITAVAYTYAKRSIYSKEERRNERGRSK